MKKEGMILGLLLTASALFCQNNVNALRLVLDPGKNWIGEGRVAIFFPIEVEPSFVWWIEDSQGNYIETIYLSGKIASGDWNATKGRPEALPVWGHARGEKNEYGEYLPSKMNPLIDAQTSATPTEEFSCTWEGIKYMDPGQYRLMMEINIAFDYNDIWRKHVPAGMKAYKNGVNGQPSLVYRADLFIAQDIAEDTLVEQFEVIGTGSPLGNDGEIHAIDGIDTAFNIIGKLEIEAFSK